MIKSKAALQYETKNRHFEFVCDGDAPLGEIYDALHVLRHHIFNLLEEEEKKIDKLHKEKKDGRSAS